VSTTGKGTLTLKVGRHRDSIEFRLTYDGLEGLSTAAHIHFGQRNVNGGVAAFLCGGGGLPACPPVGGTVEGTIMVNDVIGPSGQGIAPAEFAELLRAIKDNAAYVNVHSDKHPTGEIRGDIR
jgi:hypothetical protein